MAADGTGTLRARVEAWREAGAGRVDPVGFHRLEALLRRCEAADADLQAILQPRIRALADALEHALSRAATPRGAAADAGPLAALVAECEARRASGADGETGTVSPEAPVVHPQPPALQQARQLWKAVRTERQLRQSLEAPREDAGPLNSARLVNRMLLCMGEASPPYLEQLIGYVDVLSELEHWFGPAVVAEPASPSPGRKPAAKRVRAKRKTQP